MAMKRRLNDRGAIPRPIIGVAEFAETMGISVHCARNWIYQRRIASVKLGKLLCVPTSEVERLVTENLRPASDPRLLLPKSQSERIILRGPRPRKVEDVPAAGTAFVDAPNSRPDVAQAHAEDTALSQHAIGLHRFKGSRVHP
jgi:excisionase family DNA binding protein